MNQLRIGALIAAFAGVATVGISSAAFAQAPCGDNACEAGFECQAAEAPCTGVCYETDDGDLVCEEECSSEPYYYCAPKACDSDADCGDVMVCNTFESTECSAGVAVDCDDDGSECEEVKEEPTCTTSEYRQCAYRHELPCDSDAQCGEGFTCVESEVCWCTGSNGGDSDDSDEGGDDDGLGDATDELPPADEDVECGCEPSGEKYCQVNTVECATDADCPSGWGCAPGAESCWIDQSGATGCETYPSSCQPPGSGGNGSVGGDDGEPTGGYDEGEEDDWSDDDSAPNGPSDDTTDDGDGSDDDGGPHGDVSGIWALFGCSVNHAVGSAGSGAFGWLAAAVGLVAVRRRNRR